MNKPKYFDEMQPYFPEDIEGRIEEVKKELEELRQLKRSNRPSSEDIEDVSDNYQYHLEWQYAISELTDELNCLNYQLYLWAKEDSEINALESQLAMSEG
jgi:hypothetical protein